MFTCVSFSLPISASYLSSPSRGWTRHRRCSASGGTTTATISSPSLTTSSRSVLWLNTVFCYHHFVGTVGGTLVFLHTLVSISLFNPDRGVLRRDDRVRRRLRQVPQDDPLGLLVVLPAALHGEHVRPPHRLLEGMLCSSYW